MAVSLGNFFELGFFGADKTRFVKGAGNLARLGRVV
jgi:hypothetical protein